MTHNATIGSETLQDVQITAGDNCVTRTYDFPTPLIAEVGAGRLMALNSESELVPFDELTAGTVIGTGNGVEKEFNGSLGAVLPGTVTITDRVETFIDNGGGVLVSDGGGTNGNIDYSTGSFAVSFNVAPVADLSITADCKFAPAGILKRSAEVGDTEGDVITFGHVNRKQLKVGASVPNAAQFRLLENKHIYPA